MTELAVRRALRLMHKEWNNNQEQQYFHYAFIFRKNELIAFGKNNPEIPNKKVFDIAHKWDIEKFKHYPFLHAECAAIIKLKDINVRGLSLLSLRINKHGQFRIAKPCPNCQKAIDSLGIKNVYWSITNEQNNTLLVLNNQ